MNTSKVAILGCAKNCANYIQQSVNNMIKIGNMFNDYKIIVFENDSKDNTEASLRKFTQLNNKIKLICEKYVYRRHTKMLAKVDGHNDKARRPRHGSCHSQTNVF